MSIPREDELPETVHSVAQIRAIEARAIETLSTGSYELMNRAGAAAFRVLRASWPSASRIGVVCGGGNNAGDGYVVARLARQAGLDVGVAALVRPQALRGDAARAWRQFVDEGGTAAPWSETVLNNDVLVDAIFGVGLSRTVDGECASAIAKMNAAGRPILAIDVPSGLDADTGQVMGIVVHAHRTITFIGLKMGFFLGGGQAATGYLHCDSLGTTAEYHGAVARRLNRDWLCKTLPPRSPTAHKGEHGHVLVIGGGPGMAGAARLAGEGALRAGAGLVTVATSRENIGAIVSGRPELMVRDANADLRSLIGRATAIALGPGLGQDEWSRELFSTVVASQKPLVIDADGLNLLAQQPSRRGNWVLTPHPGEAARLLGTSTAAVQEDRLASVRELVSRFGGIAVLKGAGTLVSRDQELALCAAGNPGMATAGVGDVLTGVVAGLAAQLRDLWNAACAGVLVHALAGDAAAETGQRGMIASDLLPFIRSGANPRG